MKKQSLVLVMLLFAQAGHAQVPTQLGGFALNSDVEQYQGKLKSETTLPIRFMEALKEVEVQPGPGFKSGYVAYGSCATPGKIVRIKLKYEDSSEDFYKKLLKTFKERFGKPKWLGDPFHVVSTWKWSFGDGKTQVDLYLQHNLSDAEEKFGNSVKMTMMNLVKDEIGCFVERNPDFRKKLDSSSSTDQEVLWEDLIPR